MRDIVKEAQAIIDEFILASAETTRRVQMEKQKRKRKQKIAFLCWGGAGMVLLGSLFLVWYWIGIGT